MLLCAPRLNVSVSDLLFSLFVENQTTDIDYLKYFQQCSPSSCTYTFADQTDFTYGITLFISLYGGLIIILRLLAPFLVKIILEPKHYSRTVNTARAGRLIGFVQSMQRLNLFKKSDDQSETSIRQQKLTTRVYLLFLTGSSAAKTCHRELSSSVCLRSRTMSFTRQFHV